MQAGRGAPPPAPPVRQSGGALAVFPSTLIKKRPSDWTAAFDMADSVFPTTAAGRLGKATRRKTTPVPGVRALRARARRSRAVFRLPVGAARHAKAAVPPLWELPVRFRRLAGRGIAPAARRLAGCCTPVRSSMAGRRRLWPQANRRRRGGQGGEAPRALLWFLSWACKKGTRCRSTTDRPSDPRAEYLKPPRGGTRQLRRSPSGK